MVKHRPFKAGTRVRVPLAALKKFRGSGGSGSPLVLGTSVLCDIIGSNPVTPINLYECWNHASNKTEPKHGPSIVCIGNDMDEARI